MKKVGNIIPKKDIHYIRIAKAGQQSYWYAKHIGKIITAVRIRSEWRYVYRDGKQYRLSDYSLRLLDCVRQRKLMSGDYRTGSIVKIANWNRSYKDNTATMLYQLTGKISAALKKDLMNCAMNGAKSVHYRSENHIICDKPELFSDDNLIKNSVTITIEIDR